MADDISQIMVLRDVQFRKHHLPITPTKDGMFIEVRDVQSRKHTSPKICTEEGISMDVREVHPQYLQIVLYQRVAIYTVEK